MWFYQKHKKIIIEKVLCTNAIANVRKRNNTIILCFVGHSCVAFSASYTKASSMEIYFQKENLMWNQLLQTNDATMFRMYSSNVYARWTVFVWLQCLCVMHRAHKCNNTIQTQNVLLRGVFRANILVPYCGKKQCT